MRELRETKNATSSPPLSGNTINTANKHIWKSPIPYLFGSLAAMLFLISVALVLLICSYRKRPYGGRAPDHGDDDDLDQKPQKPLNAVDLHSDEPKIVVIMAGDNNPTYLATPVEKIITTSGTSPTDDHDHGDDDHRDHDDQDHQRVV